MAEKKESESTTGGSPAHPEIRERVERLRERTSRLADTLEGVEKTLKEAGQDEP